MNANIGLRNLGVCQQRPRYPLYRVISGGQTGVDIAALEAADSLGIAVGGWCPAGRRCESGTIVAKWPLLETPERHYPVRTRWNIRDSDATLILVDPHCYADADFAGQQVPRVASNTPRSGCSRGTALTIKMVIQMRKPYLLLGLADETPLEKTTTRLLEWLFRIRPRTLNVAGPRHSENPTLGPLTATLLANCLCPNSENQLPVWPPPRPTTADLPFL